VDNFSKFLFSSGYCIINQNEDQWDEQSNNKNLDMDDLMKKKTKEIINCPHVDRKHYAKNMCNNCYHKQGRMKKAWDCSHVNLFHYAKGKCQNCYLSTYHKNQNERKRGNLSNDCLSQNNSENHLSK